MKRLQEVLIKIRKSNELELSTPVVQMVVADLQYDNSAKDVADIVTDYFISNNKAILESYLCKMRDYDISLRRDSIDSFCISAELANTILSTPRELEKTNIAINSKIRSFLNGTTDINDIGETSDDFEIDFSALDDFINSKIDFVDDITTILHSSMTNEDVSTILCDIRDADSDRYIRHVLQILLDDIPVAEEAIILVELADLYRERLAK